MTNTELVAEIMAEYREATRNGTWEDYTTRAGLEMEESDDVQDIVGRYDQGGKH